MGCRHRTDNGMSKLVTESDYAHSYSQAKAAVSFLRFSLLNMIQIAEDPTSVEVDKRTQAGRLETARRLVKQYKYPNFGWRSPRPKPSTRPTPQEQEPGYRQNMKDSGRGHLLP